ncbi:MAG: fibronectin type III domain-containing protein [Steroidobacteraceae bacterium]
MATGSSTLSWMAPTQNTDGSALTNLSGYRIYYGTSATSLTQSIDLPSAGILTYVLGNLSPATWYFAVKAVAGGVESNLSNVASKTIT